VGKQVGPWESNGKEQERRARKKALDAAFHGQGQQPVCVGRKDDGKLHIRIAACRLHGVLCSTPPHDHEPAMAIELLEEGGRRNKQNGKCAQGPASW